MVYSAMDRLGQPYSKGETSLSPKLIEDMHNFHALKIGTNIFSKKLNGEWAIELGRAYTNTRQILLKD